MSEAESTAPGLGSRLAHYELESELGSGGMGTVYRAHDTGLDRPVALKVLRADVAREASLVDRFTREARAAARVNHPNLTHVYFVGTWEDQPWFAMEFCPGRTVEQAVDEDGPFSLEAGIDVLVQSARGLEAAHGAGVVHRDVKPSNLMLLPDGTVKVTDFGLAKSVQGDVHQTAGGRLLGTPHYVSPEQCRGREVDARTDVYLLGLTAWFVFTGGPAYDSDQLGELINHQINTPLPDLGGRRPDLPPGLETLLERMCAKDPAERPADMAAVVAALEGLRPRHRTAASIVPRAFALALDVGILGVAALAIAGVGTAIFVPLKHVLGVGVSEYIFDLAFSTVLVLTQFGAESWKGTTLGKRLMNLEVVRADGTRPGRLQLFWRFLLRWPYVPIAIVPLENEVLTLTAMGIQSLAWGGGFICSFLRSGRTLSDELTGTRVAYRFLPRG